MLLLYVFRFAFVDYWFLFYPRKKQWRIILLHKMHMAVGHKLR